mmetsp:Transcript_22095/g.50520  ORF Transcript_22095/g.50520 Transcript_22095/m.50520 type:complete len:1076 (-) Transcript_22095:84-3311(-)
MTLLPGQVKESTEGGGQRESDVQGKQNIPPVARAWFDSKNGATLQGALAFVPFILQQAHSEGVVLTEGKILVHRGSGGVVFSEASDFASLTERLSGQTNGAEQLSTCLTNFFTPLIDLINAYRGDTIKFMGDALTIYFPSIDDTQCSKYNKIVPPHGSYGLQDLGPMATAVLRASACCIEIHKRLHNFDTKIDGIHLYLHIGVGCGEISILQVGDSSPPETQVSRVEYMISGAPLEQISQAYKLARDGETCLSPQAWVYVKDCVIEGRRVEEKDKQDFHLLLRMDESRYTFPAIKYATKLYDMRSDRTFKLNDLNTIRRYMPSTVFKQIQCGTLQYVNEMRTVTSIFINIRGLDLLDLDRGPEKAHELAKQVQDVCYAHEGTLNKFFAADKDLVLLLVFGLPPLVHPDDPTRAVLTALNIISVLKTLGYEGRIGVTTGRSYCGVVGSAKRMEYTVLGDCVNMAKNLMKEAFAHGILCDEETSRRTTGEITYKALSPVDLKGRIVGIFQPQPKRAVAHIGLTPEHKIRLPWYDTPLDGSKITVHDVVNTCKQKVLKLCGVSSWAGMKSVQGPMLGGDFIRRLHDDEITMHDFEKTPPPAGSPFAEGGIVVIEGNLGMGKVELAEHIVMHCAHMFKMMPIFGTMGPRPRESKRMAVELLQSTVGVFRYIRPDVPQDDAKALAHLLPKLPQLQKFQELLRNPATSSADGSGKQLFNAAVAVVIDLLLMLKKLTPVVVVLQFDNGSNLFEKTWLEDLEIFWEMTEELAKLVQKEKSIAGLILCTKADRTKSAVKHAVDHGSLVGLKPLAKDDPSILEYMCNHLNVTTNMVPASLKNFVAQVTDGNPLFIRETLDQLLEEQHLNVMFKVSDVPKSLECGDPNRVNIAAWNHTTMIANTMCLIESLEPMEAAALKMSTCFEKEPFTLTDLAASNCSEWGGATRFDLLRLYQAVRKLVECSDKILVEVDPDSGGNRQSRVSTASAAEQQRERSEDDLASSEDYLEDVNKYGKKTRYEMPSVLMRRVGAAMVLEGQRKSVKRNALINRVVQAKLPERLDKLAAEQGKQHIPWYYEEAMRRMGN